MAHLIQLFSDPEARSLSDYINRLWSREPKQDDGLHPMERLAWQMFLLTEWLENPPLWARVSFFVALAFVVYFDVVAVAILWP